MPASSQKKEIRKKFLKIRDGISDKNRKLKSREVCRNLFANIQIPKNKIIGLYSPIKSEVDVSILIEIYNEDDYQISLPRIDSEDQTLNFHEYKIGAKLEKNKKFGMFEPKKHYKVLIPDFIIVPLVAFDSAKNRLGYGGGFYDRTLENLKISNPEITAIGIAFKEQQAPYIPNEDFDIALDAVVTEGRVFI